MQDKIQNMIREFERTRKIRRRAYAALTAMAIMVSLGTGYALMQPAQTMSGDTICGLEEHIHGESCYETVLVCTDENREGHAHSEECYPMEYICGQEVVEAHSHGEECYSITCGLEETPGHVHDDTCTGIACGLEATEGHAHSDICYGVACGKAETEGHSHGDSCYEQQSRLTCTAKEGEGHSHSDSCYGNTCGKSESEGHSHSDSCYSEKSSLSCGQSESSGHSHGAGCYGEDGSLTCSESESAGHSHGDGCYTTVSELTCGQSESEAHSHSDSCTGLTCGQSEYAAHAHDEGCSVLEDVLVCKEAVVVPHTHDESCTGLICETAECAPHAHDESCNGLICGQEEHEAHTHDESCSTLTCEVEETEGHTHATECEGGRSETPACGKEECEPYITDHIHDEACYVTMLACEKSEHTHSEDCYEQPEVYCGLEEHIHNESCRATEKNLICTEAEAEGHTHDEACYSEGELVCGIEEAEGHVHTDACYEIVVVDPVLTCTVEESEGHVHGEGCYGEPALICEDTTEGHEHGEACYGEAELICEVEEAEGHTHTDACYSVKLDCGMEAHIHTEECYVEKQLLILLPEGAEIPEGYDVEYNVVDEDNRYAVAVYAPEGALPEGAVLMADLLDEDSDEYAEAEAVLEVEYDGMVALDIRFEQDGKEVEPSEPVYVCMNVFGLMPENVILESVTVHHIKEEPVTLFNLIPIGTENAVEVVADSTEENDGVIETIASEEISGVDMVTAFTLNSFSKVITTYETAIEIETVTQSESNIDFNLYNYDEWINYNLQGKTGADLDALKAEIQSAMTDPRWQPANTNNASTEDYYKENPYFGTDYILSSGYVRDNAGFFSFNGNGKYGFYNRHVMSSYNLMQMSSTHSTYERNLYNGYPVVTEDYVITSIGEDAAKAFESKDRRSIGYLYGQGNDDSVAKYEDIINSPLRIDSDGYYYYNSKDNASDLINGDTEIVLREYTERAQSSANANDLYTDDNGKDSIADFLPFNSRITQDEDGNITAFVPDQYYYEPSTSKILEDADSDGNLLGSQDQKYYFHYENYGSNNTAQPYGELNDADMWFGATMTTSFFQPKDSLVDGEKMIYQFSGDDDVMLYLDNILVMDLSGPHSRASAEIDFYTGLVENWYDGHAGLQINNAPYDHREWAKDAASTILSDGESALAYDAENGVYYDRRANADGKHDANGEEIATSRSSLDVIRYYPSTIYECYKLAYEEQGLDPTEVQAKLDDMFVAATDEDGNDVVVDAFGNEHKIYRFKDYTPHSFKWFYMERHSGEANFNVKFNLPTLPESSITVVKEVEGTSEREDFEFQIKLTDGDDKALTSVDVIDADGSERTVTLTDGTCDFRMAGDESWTFSGLAYGTKYEVTELTANQGGYTTSGIGETSGTMGDMPIVTGFVNVYQPEDVIVDKTIEEDENGLWINMSAYVTGTLFEETAYTPTDIVLAVDTSGSMHQITVPATTPTRIYDYTTEGTTTYVDYIADKSWLDKTVGPETVATLGESVSGSYFSGYGGYYRVNSSPKHVNWANNADNNHADYLYRTSNNSYYILENGSFKEIVWHADGCGNWHLKDETDCVNSLTPKTSPADTTEGHIQFYATGYVSRMDATVHALIDFIGAVKQEALANGVEHRIALVTFQDLVKSASTSVVYHTGLWQNGEMFSYLEPSALETQYGNAFTLMNSSSSDVGFLSSLGEISNTSYHSVGTFPEPAIKMAHGIFEANPDTAEHTPNRAFVMFTDGAPTYPSTANPDVKDARSPALTAAKALKTDANVTNLECYVIAMFEEAEPDSVDINNNFLHWVSSNTDMSKGSVDKGKGTYVDSAINRDGGYYMTAAESNELKGVFSNIVTSITGSGANSDLNENAVMQDVLSDDMQFTDELIAAVEANDTAKIKELVKVYTQDCIGDEDFDGDFENDYFDANISIDLETKTIKVSGFDFAENWVGPIIGTDGHAESYRGKRLVVEVPVVTIGDGAEKELTNVPDDSGIYPDDLTPDPEKPFPKPYIDIPTTVTVKKLVDGSTAGTTFKFEADYFLFNGYTDNELTSVGDSNYLDAITKAKENNDVSFSITKGGSHTINQVVAGTQVIVDEIDYTGYNVSISATYKNELGEQVAYAVEDVTITDGQIIIPKVKPNTIITYTNKAGDIITDKTVEYKDGLWINLEAYAEGNATIEVSQDPADIVFVLDHSGTMYNPLDESKAYTLDANGNPVRNGVVASKTTAANFDRFGYYVALYRRANDDDGFRYYALVRYDETAQKWKACFVDYYSNANNPYFNTDVDLISLWNSEDENVNGPISGYNSVYQTVELTNSVKLSADMAMTGTVDDTGFELELVGVYQTRYGAAYDTMKTFIDNAESSGVDHRIAIVGFSGPVKNSRGNVGGNGVVGGGTDPYPGLNMGSVIYNGSASTHYMDLTDGCDAYKTAFKSVQTEKSTLLASLNAIDTCYSLTSQAVGLKMANGIFANVDADHADRDRIILLITDGVCTITKSYTDATWEHGSKFDSTYAKAEAINEALISKQTHGAKLYVIGTLRAEDEENSEDFLNYVSSNYPVAEAYATDDGTTATLHLEDGTDTKDPEGAYYDNATTISGLDKVFENISSTVITSKVTLNEDSILRDILSSDFILDQHEHDNDCYEMSCGQEETAEHTHDDNCKELTCAKTEREIEVYLVPNTASGFDEDGKISAAAHAGCEDCAANGIRVQVGKMVDGEFVEDADGDTIQVDGFDYSAHCVIESTNGGYKILVRLPITAADEKNGVIEEETNKDAGIYDDDDPVKDFPDPSTDTPSTVLVKKVVSGTTTTEEFSFTAAYSKFVKYGALERAEDDSGDNYLPAIWDDKFSAAEPMNDGETWSLTGVKPDGTITVTEKVPAGYHLTVSYTYTDAAGETQTVSNFNYKWDGETATVTIPVQKDLEITFTNSTGPVLPSTGGIGTNVYTVMGGLMMACAAWLLEQQRRRRSIVD